MKKFMLAAAVTVALLPAAALAQSASSTQGGNYTIDLRTAGEQIAGMGQTATANRNTDPAAIKRTIAANPGLAERLAQEGVEVSRIGAISVEPDGKVIIYRL